VQRDAAAAAARLDELDAAFAPTKSAIRALLG
jgi:hypothetical protein